MLHKFSDEIQECNQFADECRRIADETDDRHGGALAPFGRQPCIPGTKFQLQRGSPKGRGHPRLITVAVTKPSSPHCVETSAADQELAAALVTVAC